MLDVIIALIPAWLAAIYFFGWHAVRLTAVCVVACVLVELICRRWMKRDAGVTDLSAVVTGLLLAFNLPPSLPSWMAIVGCVAAIAVAKQVFGGIGYNPFNPALVGRVVLLISFPVAMTTWHGALHARRWASLTWVDGSTTATPLGAVKEAVRAGQALPAWDQATMLDLMFGRMSGCIGEVSAVALVLGGLYLLYRRCISWHIPVAYLATVAIVTGLLHWRAPETNMPILFHLFTGGLMLGAVFMATDMVTSPLTHKGMLVFGVGCGLLTVIIRRWGGYPEGVSYAILLMNAVVPLINRATAPRVFGQKKAAS